MVMLAASAANAARDAGTETAPAGFLIEAVFVGLVLVLLLAAVYFARGWIGGRRDRQPSTAWAMASLVLVRVALAWTLVFGIATLVSPGGALLAIPGGAERFEGVLTIETRANSLSFLCPFAPTPTPTAAELGDPGCRAAKAVGALASSTPASGASAFGARGEVDFRYALRVAQPTAADARTFGLIVLARSIAWIVGFLAIERIIRQATKRRPFALANIVWLRVLAAVIAVNGFVIVLISTHFVDRLIRAYEPDGDEILTRVGSETSPSVVPLGVALLVLVLAEIWRFGIRLREDAEATV